MKIVLIGFRATGKTTIGKLLAERLSLPFLDLDEYLTRREGKSIAQMVAERGWPYFRQKEREAMRELSGFKEGVIALGGGAVMHEEEMNLLKKDACVVWLKSPPEIITKRLAADNKTGLQRPSLTGADVLQEIETVLGKRLPLYQRFADLEVETSSAPPEEIVARLTESLKRCQCFGERQEK